MARKQMSYTRTGEVRDEPDDCGIGDGTLADRRFELMKIAFKQFIGHGYGMSNEKETAEHCVRHVDAFLAAMEKKPDAEGDKPKGTT